MKDNTLYINKPVTIRDYLFYGLIVLAIILMSIYLIRYQVVKVKEKTSTNYMVKNNYIDNEVKSIQELKEVLNEKPTRLILYLSYHNSKSMYNIEKDISKVFNTYDVKDIAYIYDFTELKERVNNYKDILNDTLDIDVSSFPALIIYEDGQISSYKTIKKASDVKDIFEKYKIDKK